MCTPPRFCNPIVYTQAFSLEQPHRSTSAQSTRKHPSQTVYTGNAPGQPGRLSPGCYHGCHGRDHGVEEYRIDRKLETKVGWNGKQGDRRMGQDVWSTVTRRRRGATGRGGAGSVFPKAPKQEEPTDAPRGSILKMRIFATQGSMPGCWIRNASRIAKLIKIPLPVLPLTYRADVHGITRATGKSGRRCHRRERRTL